MTSLFDWSTSAQDQRAFLVKRRLASDSAYLGRYAHQPAGLVLAFPTSFRLLLIEETAKIISAENGEE